MKDRQYEVGDQVSWESSAAGTTRRKKGVVVRVVPANQLPAQKNLGIARRNHVSYVVSAIAEGTQTERKRLYWPRASQLSLVVDNPNGEFSEDDPAVLPASVGDDFGQSPVAVEEPAE